MSRTIKIVAIVAVIGFIAFAVYLANSPHATRDQVSGVSSSSPNASRLVTLEVGGMVCAACVAKVKTTLAEVPGVSRVEVNLADQKARVYCGAPVADSSLTAAVRRAGPDYLGFVVDR